MNLCYIKLVIFLKKNLFLTIILLLASFIRFLWLGNIPNAVGGDELTYIVTAKTIALRFSDLAGVWNPLSVFYFQYPPGELQAELPYFLLAPFANYASFSLLIYRSLYAILSIFSVLVVYLISLRLFSKNAGIFAALIAAINPWFIYIGRTNYEVVPATFFFLLSFYLFLILKGWKILISIPFLFLAFYSYIGTKLIFIPFIFISIYYSFCFLNKKRFLKQYLIVLLLSILLVLFFIFSIKSGLIGDRASQIFLPNNPYIASQVDSIKKVSIQTPFSSFLINKATIYLKILTDKFVNTFSFNYLFLMGDSFYKIGHGFFYVFDLLFLILGILFAYAKKKRELILIAALIILGSIPQVFNASPLLGNFAPHISLMIPFFVILIGVGIGGFAEYFINKRLGYLILLLTVIIYLFSFLSFVYIYFFQFPLNGDFDFEVRLMSKYASLAKNDSRKVLIYSPKFEDEFRKYVFYNNLINKNTLKEIGDSFKNKTYEYKNIKFQGCNSEVDPAKVKDIVIFHYICGKLNTERKHLSIPRLLDGGESYRIYNDNLCSGFNLKPYPFGIKIEDFNIEKMGLQRFCETYVTNFR
jgi:4-amino-4-deoxy-L-arabinose transferase-like glycosyltransferase